MRHAGPRAFLDRAEPWLLLREAENNLPLGVAWSLAEKGREPGSSLYFATVESGDDVVGCAFRTPPYKLGLTRMPLEAAPLLARDLTEVYEQMPAVLGPVAVARAFGDAWSQVRGVRATPGARQRIHVLARVAPAASSPPGRMRRAGPADVPRVARWVAAFVRETGLGDPVDPLARARRLCGGAGGRSLLALWEHDGPVSMAGFPARTRHGVRIGYVYTPDEHRRSGYATALVARLSGEALDLGFDHCVLYTDLANPTSNRIYRSVGYRPVQEVMDVEFG